MAKTAEARRGSRLAAERRPRCLAAAPGEVSSAEGTDGQEATMTSDAIVLLKDDPKEIRRLFREFRTEQARHKAPRAPSQPSALKKAADAVLP